MDMNPMMQVPTGAQSPGPQGMQGQGNTPVSNMLAALMKQNQGTPAMGHPQMSGGAPMPIPTVPTPPTTPSAMPGGVSSNQDIPMMGGNQNLPGPADPSMSALFSPIPGQGG